MAGKSQTSKSGPVIGLALGGGAALGWAHIGALRVLAENGIEVGAVAGTSIGALVGACSIAGVLDPLEDIARGMTWRRMLGFADPQMGAGGIFKGGVIVGTLERYLAARRIETLDRPYAAVAADLITGDEVRITEGVLSEAVRASISIPGIFTPVQRGSMLLVDGGIVEPVPVAATRALGADIVVAVDVTGDYHGRARAARIGAPIAEALAAPDQDLPAWMRGAAGHLFRRAARRPGLYGVTTTSIALMMRELTLAKMRMQPPDVHVIPDIGHISMVEFDRADDLIAAGRAAMAAQLDNLRKILGRRAENVPE